MPRQAGTLHVVFSDFGAGILRDALEAAGRPDPVITFPDGLASGPIDPPSPAARARWMTDRLGFAPSEWAWLPAGVARFWRRASAPAGRRVVWTSSRTADQHAAFLHWVDRMDERPYEVIDLADLEVTHRSDDGRTWRGPAMALEMLDPHVIAAEAVWERARSLSHAERLGHAQRWRRLRTENAPFRVFGPDGLRSAPISCFDENLVSHASREWRRASYVIAGALAADFPRYLQVGDWILAARVYALIGAGELESRVPDDGSAEVHGHSFGSTRFRMDTEVRLRGA